MKRIATEQITKQTYGEKDNIYRQDPSDIPRRASNEILAKRKISVPRSLKKAAIHIPENSMKGTVYRNGSSDVDDLNKVSVKELRSAAQQKEDKDSSNPSKSFTFTFSNSSNVDNNEVSSQSKVASAENLNSDCKYQALLKERALNHFFLKSLQTSIEDDPFKDLTEILKQYISYRKAINEFMSDISRPNTPVADITSDSSQVKLVTFPTSSEGSGSQDHFFGAKGNPRVNIGDPSIPFGQLLGNKQTENKTQTEEEMPELKNKETVSIFNFNNNDRRSSILFGNPRSFALENETSTETGNSVNIFNFPKRDQSPASIFEFPKKTQFTFAVPSRDATVSNKSSLHVQNSGQEYQEKTSESPAMQLGKSPTNSSPNIFAGSDINLASKEIKNEDNLSVQKDRTNGDDEPSTFSFQLGKSEDIVDQEEHNYSWTTSQPIHFGASSKNDHSINDNALLPTSSGATSTKASNSLTSGNFAPFGNSGSSAPMFQFHQTSQKPTNNSQDQLDDKDDCNATIHSREGNLGSFSSLASSRGQGEEDEETLIQAKSKVYLFSSEEKQYNVLGTGILKLNKDKNSGKHRILVRLESSGRVICNVPILKQMEYQIVGKKRIKFPTPKIDQSGVDIYIFQFGTEVTIKDLQSKLKLFQDSE